MPRVNATERIYGWWSFDADGMILLEDGGNARLRYIGRADDDAELGLRGSNIGHWLRFEAELDSRIYPLLVEVRFRRPRTSDRAPLWRLDHIRSAAMAARMGAFSPHPSYEQWFMLDHFAVDALLCWPETDQTGWKVQAGLAVNGGWCNGAWRHDFYRYYRGVSTSNESSEPWTPIARPRPRPQQQWAFVEAARRPSGDELVRQFKALASAEAGEIPTLLASIAETRPHLRSDDAIFIPLAGSGRYPGLSWLYADREVVTDCVRIQAVGALPATGPFLGFGPAWQLMLHSSLQSVIGTIDRRTGSRASFIPADLKPRLVQLTEAILCVWEDCTVDLPDLLGKHASQALPAPASCETQNAFQYAGRTRAHATIAVSLERAMALQPLFDEASPSVTASVQPLKWLAYDHDDRSMRNTQSGQSLTFERVLAGTLNFASDQDSLFRYEDGEIKMPVVVRRRGALPHRGDRRIEPYWRIDHDESIQLAGGSQPAFATWGRVSDFIFDAIMFWPETEHAGPSMEGALAMGGWLNGRWEPGLRRAASRAYAVDGATADPESPFSAMETLARWRIVGEPAPVKAKPTTIDLDRDDDYLVDPISIGDLIDGRYGDRQFQVREDLSAALFVCGSRTVRAGPDGVEVTMPVFEYCDKDVRVRFAANSQGIALDPLLAPRIVRTSPFAHDESAASYIYARSADGRRHRPGRELHRRIIDALTGGLVLRTAQQKCTIVGRFQAGVWLGHSSQSFWIDRDEVAGDSRMSDSASALRLNNGQ